MNLKEKINLKKRINNHFELNLINFIKGNKKETIAIIASACIIGGSCGYFFNHLQSKSQQIEEVTYTSKICASIEDARTGDVVLRIHDLNLDVETNKHKSKDGTLSFSFFNEKDASVKYINLSIAVFDIDGNEIPDNGKYKRQIRCKPMEVINDFYKTEDFYLTDFYDIAEVQVAINEILYDDGTRFVLNTPAISSVTLLKEPINTEQIIQIDRIPRDENSIGEKL